MDLLHHPLIVIHSVRQHACRIQMAASVCLIGPKLKENAPFRNFYRLVI